MNWEEINKEIKRVLEEKNEIEILIENMSKIDIDEWTKPYNL